MFFQLRFNMKFELIRQRFKESSVVKRLFVVLISIACGASLFVSSSEAQTAAAEKPAVTEATKNPVAEKASSKVDQKPVAAQKAVEKNVLASEQLLPASTKFWISIPDAEELEKQFDSTQFGLLAKDPAIKPFIESLRSQAKELLNKQNLRLGLDIDDLHGVHSGEICIAGVLPELDGQQKVKGAHGLVLLVDVSGKEAEAREMQKKINKQLNSRGAKQESKQINGVDIIKSTITNPKRVFRQSQSNFQVILNGQMLICDNEAIFRDVLRRLSQPKKIQAVETLGAQSSFQAIMKQADLKEHATHIRWFIDPFGYIQLAQALEEEEKGREPRDDWAKILKDQGFSAFKGIGGKVSVATSEHEILHRTFTYAPKNQPIKNIKRVLNLFEFSGNSKPLTPANWVPTDSSAYVVGNWNYSKALTSVGGLYDAFLDEEGAWERTLSDFKVDTQMQLDIKKLVGLLDNRVTMVSAIERPIDEKSERVVLGFPLKGEPDFVFKSLQRATSGKVINLGGIKVLEVDSAVQQEDEEYDEFDIPNSFPADDAEDAAEPPKRTFELFAKRYFVVHNGNLLVANDKNYLRKILVQKESGLAKSEDYIQVKEIIGKLTDENKVCWRQFGRMDLTLEANYEMLRRGEMANSQTVLARLVNQVFANHAAEKAAKEGKQLDENELRKQKLDGSKLPKNYAKSIAPYFGPMGWVMEAHDDGWLITGCVIKKKGITTVVQKTDKDADSQQR
jgi:hypothetical protein